MRYDDDAWEESASKVLDVDHAEAFRCCDHLPRHRFMIKKALTDGSVFVESDSARNALGVQVAEWLDVYFPSELRLAGYSRKELYNSMVAVSDDGEIVALSEDILKW